MLVRKRNRWLEILKILIKHRFLLFLYKQEYRVKNWAGWSPSQQRNYARRIRLLCEELGPAFIKLGQLLSTRPDLIPSRLAAELTLLQERVEPMSPVEVGKQVKASCGQLPEEIFAHFDYQPAASASISQVHFAILITGERVAVKVQRPEIQEIIYQDLEILKRLLPLIRKQLFLDRVCNPDEILSTFQRSILQELDFCREGQNMENFREVLGEFPFVVVPQVFWRYTTKEILTMQWLVGYKVAEYRNLVPVDVASNQAKKLILALLLPLFRNGVFHGDPHPGNVRLLADGRIVFFDFGIIGRFTDQFRLQATELMWALWQGDVEKVVEISLSMGQATEKINRDNYYEDTANLVNMAKGMGLEKVSFGNIVESMIHISLDYGVQMPSPFFLLGKTLVMGESLAKQLDPRFNILSVTEELGALCMQQTSSPFANKQAIARKMLSWQEMAVEIPGELGSILKQLARGEMRFIFHHRNLQWLLDMLEVLSSRIALSLIVSALTLASAVTIHSKLGPTYYGIPIVGLIGFAISLVIGSWMAIFFIQRIR